MGKEILDRARKNKNDEFYTYYKDIENEIKNYVALDPDIFRNKVILCPCDDYRWSNFTKYFMDHFEEFGLKELISSCYIKDGNGLCHRYDGNDWTVIELNGDGDFRSEEVTKLRDEADYIITNPPFSFFQPLKKVTP